jgi:hypothetical protein
VQAQASGNAAVRFVPQRETILALKVLIKLLDISGDSTAQRLLRLYSPFRQRLFPVLIFGMCVQLRHL